MDAVEEALSVEGPWPHIVMFELPDHALSRRPPSDGRAYRVKVQPDKLPLFEELCRSGKFYRFLGMPGGRAAAQDWRAVLGLPAMPAYVNPDDAEKAFRRLAFDAHPDRGGSHERMVDLLVAISEARRDLTMRDEGARK